MDAEHENPAEEINRLRRCVNDLVSVLALPAMWVGADPSQIVRTLLDVLPEMLHLDLVYARVDDSTGAAPIEMVRVSQPEGLTGRAQEFGAMLKTCLGDDPKQWPSLARNRIGEGDISMVPLRLGMKGEIGIIVAGSRRLDFPGRTEKLLLDVTANQALIALQEARLRSGQKRVADELEQRVAERTRELATANAELGREVAERGLAETKLRREQGELRRSEARNAAILVSALDCIVTMDDQGFITEFNPAAERTFGYRRDEVVGKRLAEVMIPPSLREAHRRGLARYLATGQAQVLGRRIELRAVRADGSEFPVELAITRIPIDGPPSFTGYLRDITERKMSEEKLRRSEAYLAEAQKLSLTGSFGWKVATDEHFWSDETFRIFGYDASAKITLALILDRIHPQDIPLVRDLIGLATDLEDFDYECRLLLPDRSVKYVHVVAHIINGQSNGREFVGAVMDITARRRAEEALRQAQADLAHVSRVTSLGELTASIAHELNQPLGSVVNNANACLSLLPEDTAEFEEVREALTEIIQGADQAGAVIARVRQFLRKAPSERTVLNLRDVIADVLALTRHDSAARQVKMRTELTEDMPSVQGDRVQLQQVLLNLVINGMEAMHRTEESERVLTISGWREVRDGAPRCLLGVQDAGTGFRPEEMDQLFEAFYTTKPQGMGMGLAISRSIIEAHDGRLWAESNPGRGATFLLSLPAARSAHS